MARSIRIAACRTAFVIVCLVPLIGTIACAAWQRWSDMDAEAVAWIAARLGTGAEVMSLRASAPGVDAADGVKLLDPETGQLLVNCRNVRIRRGPAATVVSIGSADIPSGQLMALWRMLHERVLKQRTLFGIPLIVSVDRVALQDAGGQVELEGFRLEYSYESPGARAAISFRPAGDLDSRPVRIHLTRDHGSETPSTRIDITSHDQALDCSLVTGAPAWLRRFGDQVLFQGNAWVDLAGQDWRGEVTGQLHGIQLQRLAGAGWIPDMSGNITVDVRSAKFQRGRIEVLDGILLGRSGTIASAALKALSRLGLARPGMRSVAPNELAENMIEFDALAMKVALDASGLAIAGILNPEERVAMAYKGQPILRSTAEKRFPVAGLIEWSAGVPVPEALLTKSGAALYAVLPLVDQRR